MGVLYLHACCVLLSSCLKEGISSSRRFFLSMPLFTRPLPCTGAWPGRRGSGREEEPLPLVDRNVRSMFAAQHSLRYLSLLVHRPTGNPWKSAQTA